MKRLPLQDEAGDSRPRRQLSPGLWVGLGSALAFVNICLLGAKPTRSSEYGTWLQVSKGLALGVGFAILACGAVLCWKTRSKFVLLNITSALTGLAYALIAWDMVVGYSFAEGANAVAEALVAIALFLCYLAHLLSLPILKARDVEGDSRVASPAVWVGLGWSMVLINNDVLKGSWFERDQILWLLGIEAVIFLRGAILSWKIRRRFPLLAASSILSGLAYFLPGSFEGRHYGFETTPADLVAIIGIVCYTSHLLALPFHKAQDRVRESPGPGPTACVGFGWLTALAIIFELSTTWFEMGLVVCLLGIGIALFFRGAILSFRDLRRFTLLAASSIFLGLTYFLFGWDEANPESTATLKIWVVVTGILCYLPHLISLPFRKDRDDQPLTSKVLPPSPADSAK